MGHAGLLHSITCPSPRHLHLLTTPQQYTYSKEKTENTFTVKCFDSTAVARTIQCMVSAFCALSFSLSHLFLMCGNPISYQSLSRAHCHELWLELHESEWQVQTANPRHDVLIGKTPHTLLAHLKPACISSCPTTSVRDLALSLL